MKAGAIISALAHGIMLLLVFLEPRWNSPSRSDEIIINEVTLISTSEFDAAFSNTPIITDANIAAMRQPTVEVDDAAHPELTHQPAATEIDVTEAPSERDVDPDLSAIERLPQPEVAVETAQPNAPSVLPQVSPVIGTGEVGNAPSPVFLAAPQPRAAPSIDSFSAPALPDNARVSDHNVEATTPDETATETIEETTAEAMPESVTEIVPEAQPDVPPSAAPPRAPLPVRRPANVARTAEAIDQAAREAEEAAAERDAIDALAEAVAAENAAQIVEQQAVVLSGAERQGIIDAVSDNWNKSIIIGKENYELLVIVLEVSIAPNGAVIKSSIKPIEPKNPTGDLLFAYETAARSLRKVGVIPLPAGQFPEGVRLELRFDPALVTLGFN